MRTFQELFRRHPALPASANLFRYLGPGILVTVGFIDPGNWAANVAAGAQFGYTLLWVVTLSTLMLVLLQHNAAHLGIATGLCLSEAATAHLPRPFSVAVLLTAVAAAAATALAELLGAAIALQMLFQIPVRLGALLTALLVGVMLLTNSYRRIEKWIIGFVSLIGLSFLLELWLAEVEWSAACRAWVRPSLPPGSLPLVTAILGAVVMPHNLFLHSEIIQSREWNLQDKVVIRRQLRFEFLDTLFSMGIGWVVNSAMIITAAATFFRHGVAVTELAQAQELLHHLLGPAAALLFALALLLSGVSSSITAGMAGSSIMAGLFGEPYNIRDVHSRLGAGVTYLVALLAILVIPDPFQGLIYSQIFLCLQLPLTVLLLVTLTSSRKVMGEFANSLPTRVLLAACAAIVTVLNIQLLLSLVG